MIRAIHYPDKRVFREAKTPGSVHFEALDHGETGGLWYFCPCGCGVQSRLEIGHSFKPSNSSAWRWDGNSESATLTPSVNHVGHWHGWLRNGYWEQC